MSGDEKVAGEVRSLGSGMRGTSLQPKEQGQTQPTDTDDERETEEERSSAQKARKKRRRRDAGISSPETPVVTKNLPGGKLRKANCELQARNRQLMEEMAELRVQLRAQERELARLKNEVGRLQQQQTTQQQQQQTIQQQQEQHPQVLMPPPPVPPPRPERQQQKGPQPKAGTAAVSASVVNKAIPMPMPPLRIAAVTATAATQAKTTTAANRSGGGNGNTNNMQQQQQQQQLTGKQLRQRRKNEQRKLRQQNRQLQQTVPPSGSTSPISQEIEKLRRLNNLQHSTAEEQLERMEIEGGDDTWATVVRRGRISGARSAVNHLRKQQQQQKRQQEGKIGLLKKRQPSCEAVIIARKSEETGYADLIRAARQGISLEEVGVLVLKTRYTRKGEMLLELKEEKEGGIDAFTQRLQQIIGEKAGIRKPERLTTVLLLDLDPSSTNEEIEEATGGRIKAPLQIMGGGRGQSAKIELPISRALDLAKMGKIRIGWSVCRVRSLETAQRQQRCFRCLRTGHLAKDCSGPDISKRCYRCGEEGHGAVKCLRTPCCPVCMDIDGSDAAHTLGSVGCAGAGDARRHHDRGKK